MGNGRAEPRLARLAPLERSLNARPGVLAHAMPERATSSFAASWQVAHHHRTFRVGVTGPKPLRAGGDAIAPRPARSLQPVPRPRRTLYLFGAREPLQADPAAISAFSALRKLLNRAKGRKIQLARHGSCHSKCHSSRSGTRFYARKIVTTWSPLTESNRRPSPYHGDALPTELRGPVFSCRNCMSAVRYPVRAVHSGSKA
jgi:hypothetical protein